MTGETAPMIDDDACAWAARIDRGLADDESVALDGWLDGDPRRRGALLRAQAAFALLDRARALDPGEQALAPAPEANRRQFLRLGGGGLAAMIVAGFGWRLWPRGRTIRTALGEIRHASLEDGSTAVVNSASDIRLSFTSRRRDVELSRGEAFFQVAKDRARPFTVMAGPVHVQAVGTAFDVRRHEDGSEIVVTEGVVRLWSIAFEQAQAPVLVRAGYRAVMSDRAGVAIAPLSAVEAEQQLAWREGRIVLDDMTLAAAAAEFNRYHHRQLSIDPALAERPLVGWFRTDDLDGFATASAAIVGGRVEQDGQQIRIVQ